LLIERERENPLPRNGSVLHGARGEDRERPTFAVAEKVLQQDYKLKLPNRTFLQLFNTPEISQFRGYQNELDEAEKR